MGGFISSILFGFSTLDEIKVVLVIVTMYFCFECISRFFYKNRE